MPYNNKGKNNPMYGKRHTEETKIILSEMFKGKHHSPKTEFKKGDPRISGPNNNNWKPKIIKTCGYCNNKKFEVKPCRKDTAQFCSRACKAEWQREHFKGKNNPNYGNHKLVRENNPNYKGGKFVKCLNCNKLIWKSPWELSRGSKFCSRECTDGYKVKNNLIAGENHPNWQGGTSFEPYTPEFNEQLKLFIRQRDNFTCQFPDCNLKENGHAHDVHHIDWNKFNNNSNNLITLCRSCNVKVNYNREYWTNYFQNKLSGNHVRFRI